MKELQIDSEASLKYQMFYQKSVLTLFKWKVTNWILDFFVKTNNVRWRPPHVNDAACYVSLSHYLELIL